MSGRQAHLNKIFGDVTASDVQAPGEVRQGKTIIDWTDVCHPISRVHHHPSQQTCTSTHTHIHAHRQTHRDIHIHTLLLKHIYTCIHTQSRTHTHTHIHSHSHMHTHTTYNTFSCDCQDLGKIWTLYQPCSELQPKNKKCTFKKVFLVRILRSSLSRVWTSTVCTRIQKLTPLLLYSSQK